ncbi:MAG: hypothetical protein HY721_12740 [Planctomycetes bacterium]|nr:hypothetical protein [Planctomycetota bacterium]
MHALPGCLTVALTATTAVATTALAAGPRLENEHMAIELAPEEAGLGAVLLEHRAGGEPVRFAAAAPADALLWRLVLRGPGEKAEEVRVDNRAPCRRSAELDRASGAAELRWEGIALPGEEGALDVAVRIALPSGSAAARWRITFTNRSTRLGPWEVQFPVLAGFGEKGKLDLGVPRGNWGVFQRGASSALGGYYPSNDWPMQLLLAHVGDRGLLVAAKDPEAWPKRFAVEPGGELRLTVYPEDMGKPGAGFRGPFEIETEAYRGSWWAGAKRYRVWALGAPWARRGPIARRKDFPAALRRTALWWLGGGAAGEVVPRLKAAAARFDVPLAVHWYNWHQIPFDVNYPEYFPTKPGFAEAARELVAAGHVVMPYINGRLWDVAGTGFAAARPAACKQPGGSEVYIETYGSGAKLAPMCPATPLWRGRVGEIVRRLFEAEGVNAVYVDQVGSAAPVLCHDPSHGHPLGGGGHWVKGYREMLEPLRELAASRGLFLTTENNAEPYMDTVDAFLIWLPRSDDEVPLMTAVYGGHSVYFSSPSREGVEPDAFAMVQGRDLLWGCQLGWMGFDLLDPGREQQARYLLECGRWRCALEPFLLEGELLGEVAPLEPPPPIEAAWGGWKGTHPAKLPSVVSAVWRAADGRAAVLLANLSREPRAFAYDFDAAAWGLGAAARAGAGASPSPAKLRLARIAPGKREELGEAEARFRRTETLAPREIAALEVTGR